MTKKTTKNKKDYYNLEYSQRQGFFHFAKQSEPPSEEFKVIWENVPYEKCAKFTRMMYKKYPNVNTTNKPVPDFLTISEEFESFLIEAN